MYLLSTWIITDDTNLGQLAELSVYQVSPLINYSSTSLTPFHHSSLERKVLNKYSPHLEGGELSSISMRGGYLHKLFLHIRDLSTLLHLFIQLFVCMKYLPAYHCVYVSVGTQGYLFSILGYNPSLVAQIVTALANGKSFRLALKSLLYALFFLLLLLNSCSK